MRRSVIGATKMNRLIRATAVSVALISGTFSQIFAQPLLQPAPLNKDFTNWQTSSQNPLKNQPNQQTMMLQQKGNAPAFGYIPGPVDVSRLFGVDVQYNKNVRMLLAAPLSYDLRSLGYVSPVKDQGSCGSCWTFGTFGALESWMLKNGKGVWDFSEEHLKDFHGFDWTPCAGGNEYMSTAYLSRWCGPLNELDDPYYPDEIKRPTLGSIQNKLASEMIFSTSANIKNALMNFGAGYVTMYYTASSYDAATNTYYYSGASANNHAVTLVGWDDNKTVAKTRTKGAWLIKNSWGPSWGDQGYFWISYNDRKAAKYAVFFQVTDTTTYTGNYQHDPLGYVTSVGYGTSTTAWGGNVFTAKGNEDLIAVGFHAVNQNMSYEIDVYHSFNGATFSNLLGTTTGIMNAGYQTVTLPSRVSLTKGDTFGIVVKFSGSTYPVPMEDSVAGYSSAAKASPGESFVSNNGTTFSDLTASFPHANVCIKGFTVTRDQPPKANDDTVSTNTNKPVTVNVLSNDFDPDGDTIRITTISSPPHGTAVVANDSSITYTPAADWSGSDTVLYTINDGKGLSATASLVVIVLPFSNAPVITSIPPAGATEHVQWVYLPTATNPTNGVLTWSLLNAPAGMTIDPAGGMITWTPGESVPSSGLVTLKVSNDQTPPLSGSQLFTISVTPINDPPMITSIAPTSAIEHVQYSYLPTAIDPENNALAWSISGAPAGMIVNQSTGLITWTPGEGVSTSGPMTLMVADNGVPPQSARQTFTISVTPVNDPPVITSTAPTTAMEGVTYSYKPSAVDPENGIVTWSLATSPMGMTIDPATGTISWTPVKGVLTSGTITLVVTDNGAPPLSAQQVFTIIVTPATSSWTGKDIGSVGIAGSYSLSSGTFIVAGSGADIWNTADAFQFVYKTLSGNGEIIAQVASVQNTDGWAKAGVMIRESLTAGSKHAMMVMTPINGAAFQRRTSTNGTSYNTQTAGIAAPYWVRLVRSGTTFTGYCSSNGSTWTKVGSATVSMATNVYIGLSVTAHNNSKLCTSLISAVTTSGTVN